MSQLPELRDADPAHFQLGVQTWDDADEVVLWHPITGRHVRLHHVTLDQVLRFPDTPRLGPLRQRLDREHLLRSSPRPDWPALIPVRSRLALFLPDEALLWLPVPGYRGPGGRGYRAFQLSPAAARIWSAINDSRPVSRVAELSGCTVLEVQALCTSLTGPELQALQLRHTPPRSRDLGLERLVDVPRPPNSRPPHVTGAAGETTLTWYHLHAIDDGATHFDDRETTVAHSLGLPHPALGDRRYGAALRASLTEKGVVPGAGLVVEVGCGTGELAQAWCETPTGHRYLRIDLSPELLRTQRARVPNTWGILGDGTRLPLRDACVDLLVSNEVIADMQSVPVDPADPTPSAPAAEALTASRAAGVEPFVARHWVNLGAWRFVAEVARVLRPGGAAWLSEFGVLDGPPAEAVQLDHPEVAIQFDHLARIARHHGLTAELQPLADDLDMDFAASHLARPSWHALRALARSRDVHLQARAWTPTSLRAALPWRVEGLRFVPMTDEGPGPLVTRFYGLTLRRPR